MILILIKKGHKPNYPSVLRTKFPFLSHFGWFKGNFGVPVTLVTSLWNLCWWFLLTPFSFELMIRCNSHGFWKYGYFSLQKHNFLRSTIYFENLAKCHAIGTLITGNTRKLLFGMIHLVFYLSLWSGSLFLSSYLFELIWQALPNVVYLIVFVFVSCLFIFSRDTFSSIKYYDLMMRTF